MGIAPLQYPHPKAQEMASNADDILAQAVILPTMAEAVADCILVAGTSARTRALPWPLHAPRQFAEIIRKDYPQGPIAIVFGREQSGLTNEELQQCHLHLQIPANPQYSSLNIAQAVQVIAYELRVAALQAPVAIPAWDYPLATAAELEAFYQHLQTVLRELDFLKLSAPRKLMPRLRRLFNRARLDNMEINILRGMLRAVQDALLKKD